MKILALYLTLFPCWLLGQGDLDLTSFTGQANTLLENYVDDGKVDYAKLKRDAVLDPLVAFISTFEHGSLRTDEEKSYLINAYNILVLKGVVDHYPINSLLKIFGFFDQMKWQVGSKTYTLDALEKQYILDKFPDPRLHFALACGATGCPPLAAFAYTSDQLNEQLEERTSKALNDDNFVKVDSSGIALSQIFNWYAKDFGGNKSAIVAYINGFRSEPIDPRTAVNHYPYDWSLNDQKVQSTGTNASRYVVSSTIPKGGYELKIFNNLYSQVLPQGTGDVADLRESYFSSILNFVYGVAPRINVGFDLRYRGYSAHNQPSSPFHYLTGKDALRSRGTIATFGPKIRFAPNVSWPNFSVQSALWFPIRDDLEGQSGEPWVDWQGPTWWTQFFNDFDVGSQFSLFTEVDFLLEDIGNKGEGALNRISTPVTAIFSYFPNRKTTLYGLAGFSPYWSPEVDYFFQPGLGMKYQFTPRVELELLYTVFSNSFLQDNDGRAATYNIGIRLSR